MNWLIKQTVELRHGYPKRVDLDNVLLIPTYPHGHVWKILVRDDGHDADLTGYEAEAKFVRSDDQVVTVAGSIDGNAVIVQFSEDVYAATGELRGVVALKKDSQTMAIAESYFTVREPVE